MELQEDIYGNIVNNWCLKIGRIAGKPLELLIPKCKKLKDWAISSRANESQ